MGVGDDDRPFKETGRGNKSRDGLLVFLVLVF